VTKCIVVSGVALLNTMFYDNLILWLHVFEQQIKQSNKFTPCSA